MSKTGEQAAAGARETAQIIRMSDYHPKKKGALTYPRFRKAEDERPPFPGGTICRYDLGSGHASAARDKRKCFPTQPKASQCRKNPSCQ